MTSECLRKSIQVKPLHNNGSLQWTPNGLTQTAFEGEPVQIRLRIVAREIESDDRPDLYAGTPPQEVLN